MVVKVKTIMVTDSADGNSDVSLEELFKPLDDEPLVPPPSPSTECGDKNGENSNLVGKGLLL